jgi:hypothetical protein
VSHVGFDLRDWIRAPSHKFVLLSALGIILGAGLKLAGLTTSDAIYAVTGAVVLWYAVETQAMRREIARQNTLSVQPLLITEVGRVGNEEKILIRNIGRGPALFVDVDDVDLLAHEGLPGNVAHFASIAFVEANTYVPLNGAVVDQDDPKQRPTPLDAMAYFMPIFADLNYDVTLRYSDLLGSRHTTVMHMGKDGISLKTHS